MPVNCTSSRSVVNAGEGDDIVNVYNINITGNVTLNGGIGNDQMAIYSNSNNTLPSNSIAGLVPAVNTTIGGNVTMNGGAGNDTLNFGTSIGQINANAISRAFGSVSVGGSLTMDGGLGNDFLNVIGNSSAPTTVSASAAAVSFDSNITVGSLFLRGDNDFTRRGNDTFELRGVMVKGEAKLWGDWGNDTFCVENNFVQGKLIVADMGITSQTNRAHVSGNIFGKLQIIGHITMDPNACFGVG